MTALKAIGIIVLIVFLIGLIRVGAVVRFGEALELKILIDDIDYNSVTELLVPLLAEKLEKDGKGGILGNVLAGNTNMAVSMARTLLNTMPQEKKDELVVQLVTKNRDKLLQKGGELAAKNGVRLRLCDIAAKKL